VPRRRTSVVEIVNSRLIHIGKEGHSPIPSIDHITARIRRPCWRGLRTTEVNHRIDRPAIEGIVVVVESDPNLLQIIFALRSAGRFTRLLHSRKQESDQHTDDGDDHQQLDERKAPSPTTTHLTHTEHVWILLDRVNGK
jgi:hypothetical protein